ncbi:hypothetical protein GUITHDRAFT_58746, partial [Guillardia theta CCMP2712]
QDRKCTNVLCLLFFICFWFGMLVVGIVGFVKGNPNRLRYGYDFLGRTCGYGDVKGLKYLYYPFPYNSTSSSTDLTWAVCLKDCGLTNASMLSIIKIQGVGANATTDSSSFSSVMSSFEGPQQSFAYLTDQIQEKWGVIVASAGIALGVSLLYALMLRLAAKPITFAVLIFTWFLLGGATAILSIKAGFIDSSQLPGSSYSSSYLPAGFTFQQAQQNQNLVIAAAVICGVIFLIYTLLFIFLFKRVLIAIEVIELASECIMTIPSVFVFCIFQWLVMISLFVWWIFVMLYLVAAGSWDANAHQYVWDTALQRVMIYHFFGLLWGRSFILAIGNLVVAGASAEWFLVDDKLNLVLPVLSSFRRTLRYHSGTAALGSFIIAVVQMIRWIFRYYMYQLKKMNPDSKIVKVLAFIGECCLACLERFLNFINKNAYIQTAITGAGFWTAAVAAFNLLVRNCLRIGTLNIVATIYIYIGKLFIALVTGIICALIMVGGDYGNVTDAPVFPMTIILLIAFGIASIFLDVWEICIDTIFQCYCMDEE